MNDIFDYMGFYFMSLLLAVLKITAVISWPWWLVALPAAIGVSLFLIVAISNL